jgi:hypothetical protein
MAYTVSGAAQILSGLLPTLQPLAAEIEAATRSSPQTTAQVQAAMNGVQQGLTALASADSASSAQPIIQRIESDVEAVLTVGASIQLPGVAGAALRIAMIAVPTAFMIVNMIMAQFQAAPKPAPAARR